MKRNLRVGSIPDCYKKQPLFKQIGKMLSVFFLVLSFLLITTAGWAQQSVVTVSTNAVGASTGGTWATSGSGATLLYTFTPNAGTASVSATEIADILSGTAATLTGGIAVVASTAGSVTITSTTLTGGVATGSITVAAPITAINPSFTTAFTLTFTSTGNIAVNPSSAISLTGAAGTSFGSGAVAGFGENIFLTTTGASATVSDSSTLTTTGGAGFANPACCSTSGASGTGGNINISGPGGITVSSLLTTNGGAGGNGGGGSDGGAGGIAGIITLNSTAGAITTAGLSATAGAAGTNSGTTAPPASNTGSNITITANLTVTVNGAINTAGGNGVNGGIASSNIGSTGGKGGNISITGPTGITIPTGGSLSTIGGITGANGTGGGTTTNNAGGIGGTITLSSASGIVTISGTASISSNGNTGGSGATAAASGGAGGAGGNISISGSGLSFSSSVILSAAGGAGGASASGKTNTTGGAGGNISLISTGSGAGSVTISQNLSAAGGIIGTGGTGGVLGTGGAYTITDAGSSDVISGVLAGGALTKMGVGALTLSGANTYNGATTISAGTLIAGTSVGSSTVGSLGNSSTPITLGDANTTTNNSSPSLLIGAGNFTISRNILIANRSTSGVYSIGGNTANSGTFGGTDSIYQPLTITQVTGGTLAITGGISAGNTGAKNVTFNNAGALNITTTAIANGLGSINLLQTGAGTTALSVGNSYTGTTTISAGVLQTSAATGIPAASNVILNGGTLSGSGPIKDSMTNLTVSANSIINFASGSGVATVLKFTTNTTPWTANTITVNGWFGSKGSAGTAGKLFVGKTAILNATDLGLISFTGFGTGAQYVLPVTGEVVPNLSVVVTTDSVRTASITTTGATIYGSVNASGITGVTGSFDYGAGNYTDHAGMASVPGSFSGSSVTKDSLVITGLLSNTLYQYRANSIVGGVTTNSTGLTFVTPPNPATLLTAATPTISGFTVNWTAPSSLTTGSTYTYLVIASTTSTFTPGTTDTSASIPFGTTTYTFSPSTVALASNTKYWYEVEVVSGLAGAKTAILTSVTAANPATISTLPSIITTVATSVTTTSATINGTIINNWTAGVTGSFDYGAGNYTDHAGVASVPSAIPATGTTNDSVLTVTSLIPNTLYQFRANYVVGGVTTNSTPGLTFVTVPAAPTAVSATAATATGFTVNWTPAATNGGTYTYTVEVATNSSFTGGTQFTGIASGTLTKVITGLPAGTYYYEVQVVSTVPGGSSSVFTTSVTSANPITITTSIPSVITTAATSVTTTSAIINGTIVNTGTTGVTGSFDYGAGNYTDHAGVASVPSAIPVTGTTNDSALTVTSLVPNTLYQFRANYVVGGVTTNSTPGLTFVTVPAAPTAVSATTATATGFTVNWTAATNGGTYTYTVEVATNSAFTGGTQFTGIPSGTLTKVITGLPAGTYWYEVQVVSTLTGGSSSAFTTSVTFANPTTVTTIPTITTQAATSITTTSATINGTIVNSGTIGVTGSFDYGAGNYTDHAAVASVPSAIPVTGTTNDSVLTVTSLVPNTLYQFRANYVVGGVTTNSTPGLTFVTVPATPTAVSATAATATGFTVNWTAATNGGTYTYTVEVATNSSFTGGTQFTGIPSGTLTKVITGLPAGTYWYEVQVVSTLTGGSSSAFKTSVTSANPTTITTSIPSVITTAATSVTTTSAIINGTIVNTGTTGVTGSFDYGAGNYTDHAGVASVPSAIPATGTTNDSVLTVTSLVPNTLYQFRANYVVGGVTTNSTTGLTFVTVPAAPTAVSATAATATGFTVNWTPATNGGTYTYTVEVATNSSFTGGTQFTGIPSGTLTKVITGLPAGTYYYEVQVVSTVTGGSSSVFTTSITSANPVTVTTTIPFIITTAATSVKTTSATINGTIVNTGTTGVTGSFDYGAGNYTDHAGIASVPSAIPVTGTTNDSVLTVTSLVPNTLYQFRANYIVGGVTTNSTTGLTFVTVPAAPTAVAATAATATGFTVSWTPATNGGTFTYTVKVATNSLFTTGVQTFTGITSTSTVLTTLPAGTYWYEVQVVSTLTGGSSSAFVTSVTSANPTTVTTTIPSVTTKAATSVTTTSATINGTIVNTGTTGVTGSFDYGAGNYTDHAGIASVPNAIPATGTTNDSVLTVTSLVPNTLYQFRANYVVGGVTTNSTTGLTFVTVPAAPTAVSATAATATGFTVNWIAATNGGTYTYTVEVATNSSFTGGTQFTGIASGTLTKVITGLPAGTYYYEVQVVSTVTGGSSSVFTTSVTSANPTTITTIPAVTTNAATSITTTSATINGTIVNGGTTGVTGSFDYGVGNYTDHAGVVSIPSAIPTGTINDSAFTITSLVSNTSYQFRANYVVGGVTTNSTGLTFITPPNAPTGITANSPTAAGFTVSWVAPTNIGAGFTYTVIASTSNTFSPVAASVSSGTTSATFTTLASSTTYYYEVQTVSTLTGAQTSTWNTSGSSTITTLAASTPGCVPNGGGGAASPALIGIATSAPTIDGAVDAIWSSAPTNSIATTIACCTANNPQTGSTWKALYDATNLYILVQVADSTLNLGNATSGGTDNYDADAVELYINTDGSSEHQTRFNWGLAANNAANITGNGGPLKTGVTWAIPTVTGHGYNLEVSIPWTTINNGTAYTPVSGNSIRFDVSIDQDTTKIPPSPSGVRASQIGWFTNQTDESTNTSRYGYALLATCGHNPVIVSNVTSASITTTSAIFVDTVTSASGGTLRLNGSGTQYGTVSSLATGTVLPYSGTPVVGVAFATPIIASLAPQTKYYYQGYAANNYGTGTSSIQNFYTLSALPTIQPVTFTAASSSSSGCPQVVINWSPVTGLPVSSQATSIGYVILRKQGATAPDATGITNRYPPFTAGFNALLPTGVTAVDTISYAYGSLPSGTSTFNDVTATGGLSYSYELVPYTYDGTPTDSTYNYFTTSAKQIVGATANYNTITWLGNNTNWNDVTNWCGGIVPTVVTNVVIPNGVGHYPILSTVGLSTTGYADTISLASAASLTIGTGGSLSIHGAVTNSGGTFNAAAGTIVMGGNAAQSLTGVTFVNRTIFNLMDSTTSGGLAIDSINIIGELGFPYAGTSSLAISKSLVLHSDTATTAWVGPITEDVFGAPEATITGKVIVQRYFPSHRRWRLITAPVTVATGQTINAAWQEGVVSVTGVSNPNPLPGYGTHISGPAKGAYHSGLGYDQTPTNSASITYIKDTSSTWYSLPNTNVTKVTDKQGYMLFVRGARDYNIATTTQYTLATNATLRTTGSLKTGIQNVPVIAGPNVIGNPYAATINFNTIYNKAATKAALGSSSANNTFYLWDPNIASAANVASGTGGWVVLTSDGSGGYIPVPDPRSISPFNVNGDIQSGAAFIVHAQGTGVVQFDESDKVSPAATNNDLYLFRPANAPTTSLRTTLYATAADTINYLADGVLNMFDSSFSNYINWNKDIQKQANVDEQCSIIKNGRLVAVERSLPVAVGDTIFIQLLRLNQSSYRFAFEATNFDRSDLKAYLLDTFTHTRTPIALGDSATNINFTVTSSAGSAAANRFAIVFAQASGSVTYTQLTATQQDKNVSVQWTVNNQLNEKEYIVDKSTDGVNFYPVDTTIALITSSTTGAIVYNWIDTNPVTGSNYYRITNIDDNGQSQQSNIVKVDIAKEVVPDPPVPVAVASSIAIYPNPVTNGIIDLQLNNEPTGNYSIRVINETGQVVLAEAINHATVTETKYIPLNNMVAKGIYILEVQLPDNTQTKIKFVNQ